MIFVLGEILYLILNDIIHLLNLIYSPHLSAEFDELLPFITQRVKGLYLDSQN